MKDETAAGIMGNLNPSGLRVNKNAEHEGGE